MWIASTKPLFAWDCLEDSPSLLTIRQVLALVPDGQLLASLRAWRGRGRNDCPVHVCWGVVLLTVLLRHPGIEACLAELRRNEGLRKVIGLELEKKVPRKWNMSRFLKVLGTGSNLLLMEDVFNGMIQRLGGAVPDLGVRTAGDSSGLNARRPTGDASQTRPVALPQAAGGRKEYHDEAGNVVKIIEWFGYKFHLLVDVKHEVVLAYAITSPKEADNEVLPRLLERAIKNLGSGRIRTLAYDKAADDQEVHKLLNREGISPLIRNRSLWKNQREEMLPGHDGRSNIVYDEAGTVYCYDKVSETPVRHKMSYIGHEPARGTLKYRCPAQHEGWTCPSAGRCNAGKKYGKTVRVKREIDLRRFPPIPRATKQFERLYKGRTAVERVNARIKIFWGADDGNIAGAERFHGFIGAIMVIHAALATLLASAPRHEGTLGQMRLSPIAQALRPKLSG